MGSGRTVPPILTSTLDGDELLGPGAQPPGKEPPVPIGHKAG
jgi:hypothetical protein